MAQRERLGHLKFMQRAKLREEENVKAKQEEAKANSDQWVLNSKPSAASSCVVIVEGDPKPSSVSGRMSFRSFNPSFEVPSGEAASSQKKPGTDQESTVITSQESTAVVAKKPRNQ
ncbi:M-phase phosphoprotein 6, animal type [Marchantia polymorpha subsp. ruderalis]|uniref:Uncharacterized protein n=2 Tax=Marchantia polymorpha TaxID=3197 RepID=A0A176W294_MARPO|nr:hypothetical protein AXG93_3817s1150 [Marchantia polymorpha subsp. ruderalis]PTQ32846.1 hypothetical protein MARPO_0094s0023 [Marchantia polymorpha]BBN02722.1 hypothetical protein Mp_2g17550 [Marchantia polymorpha subsp. ruderalis]|eukprot:PTQ32846.1 hypothetical protein MARPO_0094s0023 [Marchantia polymorpha]